MPPWGPGSYYVVLGSRRRNYLVSGVSGGVTRRSSHAPARRARHQHRMGGRRGAAVGCRGRHPSSTLRAVSGRLPPRLLDLRATRSGLLERARSNDRNLCAAADRRADCWLARGSRSTQTSNRPINGLTALHPDRYRTDIAEHPEKGHCHPRAARRPQPTSARSIQGWGRF
jgi:hypothetical protein